MWQPCSLESYLFLFKLLLFFWAENYFGLISAWVAETEQMSGPQGDEFDKELPFVV